MKLAKKKNIITVKNGILNNYFLVPNNYDFDANDAVDVTSPSALEVFTDAGLLEYGVFRDTLAALFVPQWGTLSHDEKKICIKHFKYPANITQEEYASYYSGEQSEMNWNIITKKSRDLQRHNRLFAAFSKISYTLNTLQVANIYMVTKDLCFDYYYANIPNLIFWINNGVSPLGQDYTNNGFQQCSGYSDELRDALLDILINGNYVFEQI